MVVPTENVGGKCRGKLITGGKFVGGKFVGGKAKNVFGLRTENGVVREGEF